MEPTNGATPPVFILSCERAGSTLLRYILDTHPEICSPGELFLGRLCEALAHMVDRLSLGRVDAAVTKQDERFGLVSAEVRHIVSAWMDAYAATKGKRIWCEKSPRNLLHLHVLNSVFDDGKFICLHRNCMDVVHSGIEATRLGLMVDPSYYTRNPNQISVLVDSWVDKTTKLLAFEQENASKCHRIRYEDIVARPAETLMPLFAFIGVEWDESILDKVFAVKHDLGPGDPKVMFTKKIHKNSVGLGSTISRRFITPELLEKMNALLGRLGYPPVGPDWDQAPSPYLAEMGAATGGDLERRDSAAGELFENFFPQRLRENTERLREIGGTCKFVVTGDSAGTWVMDLNSPDANISKGEREADCTILISSDNLKDMVSGKLNPAQALMQGKFRVAGNLRLARQMGQVLFGA